MFPRSLAAVYVSVYSGRIAVEEIQLVSISAEGRRPQMFLLIKICGRTILLHPPRPPPPAEAAAALSQVMEITPIVQSSVGYQLAGLQSHRV